MITRAATEISIEITCLAIDFAFLIIENSLNGNIEDFSNPEGQLQ